MDIDLYNEITLPSTLITLGLDLLGDSVDTTLSGFAREISNSAVDQLVSFASQLEGAGLTVCNINDLEDANEGNPIGHGTTVSVFKCCWKSRNKLVAVKRMNLGIPLGTSMLEVHKEEYRASLRSLFLEFRVLNHTWFKVHPNFVDLYGVCWDRVNEDDSISGHRPSMIVELADESTPTLKELVNHHGQSPVDIELMLNLLTDTAEGMTMLHATKIVHGDLKPENILLFPSSKRLVAKISDFGFCSPFAEGKDQIGGTYYWNAPVS
jgi:serine/threonine protein kinase